MIDKNLLLEKFSKNFGLDTDGFIDYCIEKEIANPELLIAEFEAMRNQIYDKLWEITKPDLQLSSEEILKISKDYLASNYKWIDESGIKTVNNWLLYMCWHDGLLK